MEGEKKRIILTGGGSGGHLAPIRAVAPQLQREGYKLLWIGATLFEENASRALGIPFKRILSGKFRRGKSMKNLLRNLRDLVKVGIATLQSLFLLKRKKPERVFSTGGFVSVPVVLAAGFLRIPVTIHEQTIGFGLANKIALPFADHILLAFEDSKKYIPQKYHDRIEVVGNPLREQLLNGSREELERSLGTKLKEEKPILYITGGGQGSQLINRVIFENLDWLTEHFTVLHQAGESGIEEAKRQRYEDYFPFAFIGGELADIYASADFAIARAGAGTVNELAHFGIPTIFIPLRPTQNDEQTKNAQWFLTRAHGSGIPGAIIHQEEFNGEKLREALSSLLTQFLKRRGKRTFKENSPEKILSFLTLS